jgi:hypothetical protein
VGYGMVVRLFGGREVFQWGKVQRGIAAAIYY